MGSFLNIGKTIIAYSDDQNTNNPKLRNIDWKRSQQGLSVAKPASESFEIAAGALMDIFDSTLATSLDNTTLFDLAFSPLGGDRYRLTYVGGTDPVFRTDRNLQLSGETVNFTVNANGTVTVVTSGAVNDFTNVQVGDTVFIPHTSTGDSASPFSALNVGFWLVLSKISNTSLQLVRLSGVDFIASSETAIAVASDAQFQAFSSNGIQVGDKFDITSGFSSQTQSTFTVDRVTSEFIEFISTAPLPDESGVQPGAAGITFFRYAKSWIRVEVDQPCAVRINGDSSDRNRVYPWEPADTDRMGELEKTGPTWSLSVVNRSAFTMKVIVLSAE